jgi:alpha-maltose-1-phosphate synthase
MNRASDSAVSAATNARPELTRVEEDGRNVSMNGDKPRVLLAHTTASQFGRNAVRSLAEHGMLAEFWTTVAWNAQSNWNRLLPSGLRRQLLRRSFSEAPAHQVRSVPWREVVRLVSRGKSLLDLLSSDERPFSVVSMGKHFDRRVARRVRELRPNIVYSYEGHARLTFREAKELGITCCYELPSSFWYWETRLLSEEADRNPAFAGLLPKLMDSARNMRLKDEELSLANYIFVPSQHVRETLVGVVPDEKIRVIRYGAPPISEKKQVSHISNRPLKVLFAGSLTQRKGIGYLLEAIEKLGGQVELTLVGRRFRPNAKVDEALQRWRWYETLPHAQVLEVMQQADVLVLPSLAEAFGIVVTEALACGLPVIVTPNTGSSEIIRDGHEGFIVPIRSADAIACRLETLHRDRDMLVTMSRQAQATAAENSWANYRANWANAVRSLEWQ